MSSSNFETSRTINPNFPFSRRRLPPMKCWCRRAWSTNGSILAVLEWGHGEWAGNADTSAGRRSHRATEDGPAPALPSPEKLDPDRELRTRRLLLASEKLGLTEAEIALVRT